METTHFKMTTTKTVMSDGRKHWAPVSVGGECRHTSCDRCLRVNGDYDDQLQTVTVEFAVDIGSGFLRGKEAVVCF